MSRTFINSGTCHVSIETAADGSVRLSGQDLGGFPGGGDYEYWITISPADFGCICEALCARSDVDVVDLMCANAEMIFSRGERTWLESIGVQPDFFSHM